MLNLLTIRRKYLCSDMKTKRKNRRILSVILLLILIYILYIIIGAFAPFFEYKKSDDSDILHAENFYSDEKSSERAAILESSSEALAARLALFDSAKESVCLSTFDMREGESTSDIGAALIACAKRGVKVKILVDGLSGLLRMESSNFFYALACHPNIEIKLYNKPQIYAPWTFNGRMHDKYIIVDDERYILGGRNTFDYFLGDYIEDNKSYDREVLVYSNTSQQSSAKQLKDYFDRVWEFDVSKYFHEYDVSSEDNKIINQYKGLERRYEDNKNKFSFDAESMLVGVNKITLISQEIGCYAKKPIVFDTLVELIASSSKAVRIHTPYAVMNEHMYSSFSTLASSHNISLFVNSIGNGDNIVASADYTNNKQKIIDTGITLCEFNGEYSSHSKTILIDDRLSVIGSYNFDLRSSYMDTELMLCIDSKELAENLSENLKYFEDRSIKCINEKNYAEIPDGYVLREPDFFKNACIKILSLLSKPFRCAI